MFSLLHLILSGLGGALVGALGTWYVTSAWNWRTPSSERAFQRMWRRAKSMRMVAAELDGVWSAIDLKGDRLIPLLEEIRREELTLEQSTEAIDRLRARLLHRDGADAGFPEQITGWRRSMVGRQSYPGLDQSIRIPGIAQPGDHATAEAESPAHQAAAMQQERIDGERLALAAKQEAERTPLKPS